MAKGSCHCGKVQYEVEVDTTKGLDCNCSMCLRKGTILAFAPANKFKLISGEDNLTDYLFNTHKIHHNFCKTCGVTSFASSVGPDGTPMKAINLRCIEGIDLSKIEITHYDGKNS